MKMPIYCENWPESWKKSYAYDQLEVFGRSSSTGYAFAYRNRAWHTFRLVRSVVSPGAWILDVAAAQGNFSVPLAEAGYEVTWNDLRADLIGYVRLKQEKGLVHYAPGNIFSMGLEKKFDAVLITEVIEHVAHPNEFLKKVANFLKPGGHIIMTTPNGEYVLNRLPRFSECKDFSQVEKEQFKPDTDGHIFLLHHDEILNISEDAGLVVKELRYFTNPLTNGHVKLGVILKLLPDRWVGWCEKFTGWLPFILRKKLHSSVGVLLQRF